MSDQQFTHLLNLIQTINSRLDNKFEQLDEKIDNKFEQLGSKINHLDGKIDHVIDNMATAEDQKAMDLKLRRHEQWFDRMADKLDVKLSY